MAEPIITFKNVSKTYILYKNDKERFKALFIKPKNPKTNRALNKVSFEIQRGESVGIVGDNGAGKSTLLKMITGVAFPDEGDITVDGKVAALLELTAGFSLEMTGRENIYLKGYILGLEDEYIKQIEESIIEFAELGDYIDQPVRTYSSGMKMRLGFAINVNIEPDVLVVDEALAVGDASFKRKCKDKIKRDHRRGHDRALCKPQRRFGQGDLPQSDLPAQGHGHLRRPHRRDAKGISRLQRKPERRKKIVIFFLTVNNDSDTM